MAHRNSFMAALLLIGSLLASSSAAQDEDQQQTQEAADPQETQEITDRQLQMLTEGVSVQPSESIGFVSKMTLLLRYAFLQRPNITPLHAYDPDIICRGDGASLLQLAAHGGSAAILVIPDSGGDALAIYRPTALDVATDARQHWCDADSRVNWQFGTTYPLNTWNETGRYVSSEVDLIDERLRSIDERSGLEAASADWVNTFNGPSITDGASRMTPTNREAESRPR